MKLTFCFFLYLCTVTGFGQNPAEIEFIWKSAGSGPQKFEKAIMLIPVKFHSDTATYYLQFDTGATHSSLYTNRLENSDLFRPGIETSIGYVRFKKIRSIKVSNDKSFSVGTLGADFLKNKTVQIDYKDKIIKIDHAYDANQYDWEELSFLNGRPLVKVKLAGQEESLLYDTGSSLFGIWTTKKRWKNFRNKTVQPITFPISSWGKINMGFYNNLDSSVSIFSGDNTLSEDLKIWYVANRKFKRFFRKNDLFGILGNQPFYEEVILLDYPKKRFGIKKHTFTSP